MDPTEIISIPFPAETLGFFVGMVSIVMFLVSVKWWEPWKLFSETKDYVLFATLAFFAMTLCGVNPSKDPLHTMWCTVYVSTLAWLSPGSSSPKIESFRSRLLRRTRVDSTMSRDDIMASCRCLSTLLVSIPFQVLHILDWGAQIQRWPLPIIIGCTVGWVVGTTLGSLISIVKSK